MIAPRSPNRRGLLVVGASVLAAGALALTVPVRAFQTDRELLDLLLGQEQIQVVYYSAILDAFDDAAFSAAGLPEGARGAIESILAAEKAHITALPRPAGADGPDWGPT